MALTFGPYSPIWRAGDLLFIAGHVGVNPHSKSALPDIEGQTMQVLTNLENTMRDVGFEIKNIVKTTVYLVSMDDFTAMNKVYEQYFAIPRPVRSTVGVSELPRVGGDTKLLVEIDAVAYVGK